jgi:hypothetical protein
MLNEGAPESPNNRAPLIGPNEGFETHALEIRSRLQPSSDGYSQSTHSAPDYLPNPSNSAETGQDLGIQVAFGVLDFLVNADSQGTKISL